MAVCLSENASSCHPRQTTSRIKEPRFGSCPLSKKILAKYVICVVVLFCLFLFTKQSHSQSEQQDPRFTALAPWSARGNIQLIDVPAANNALSNMLMVASLKAGAGSQTVERLVNLLRDPSNSLVAVMRQKNSVTEATVHAALTELTRPDRSSVTDKLETKGPVTLLFVGNPEDVNALRNAAATAGVIFEIAPLP